MAVKYQVFVSSTFADLQEERQVVSRSILELNHIPAGMELFPAFDQSQLEFIKRVIDDCDYYLLIVGGKYGSLTPEGISFTEAEYDYAVEKSKPVIALLHSDVGKIEHDKVEKDPDKQKRLEAFRKKISGGRLVKYWKNKEDLKSNAIISLTSSFDQLPQTGWRRNSSEADPETLKKMEAIRSRSDFYRERMGFFEKRLKSFEELKDSEVEIKYTCDGEAKFVVVEADVLIREFAAALKSGFDEDEAYDKVRLMVEHKYDAAVTEVLPESVSNVQLFFEVFEIAERDDFGEFIIHDKMIYLLKSAFKKKTAAKSKPSMDDEIPF